jgi:hypothetical protein
LRCGELAIADDENEGSRRPPLSDPGLRYGGDEALVCVGVVGRELFARELGDRGEDRGLDGVSPEAASVRRNSTQSREKD